MISIINYGVGNLGSVVNMLKHLNIDCEIITTAKEIQNASKLILPGVGSWDNGITKLNESGLINVLNEKVLSDKTPILGICLGMQILLESSDEGALPGLGWIAGSVNKFDFSSTQLSNKKIPIPHMGWNVVESTKPSLLTNHFVEEIRFYFVHSYHANVSNKENILMTCNYGYPFTCAIHQDNIWGVQFHPEKSHRFGMELMKKFSEL